MIKVQSANKSFQQGDVLQHVLKDVSFHLNSGEITAIMGVSGAGKSTFLNILGGLEQVDNGSVTVFESDLHSMSSKQLTDFRKKTVGFIFQFHNLMPSLTAYENVLMGIEAAYGVDQAASERSMHYLESVGLADKAKKFPKQLSGGEQQRVAIARAIAKEPPLILADEPTGNLDEANGDRILGLLQHIQKTLGISVCMVTHNPLIANSCDQIYLLSGGALQIKASIDV